jgi:hypothetical protein
MRLRRRGRQKHGGGVMKRKMLWPTRLEDCGAEEDAFQIGGAMAAAELKAEKERDGVLE